MPHRPLSGFRVLTLALNLPGPLAAARLRELGARVTKVEPPWGDPLEEYAPDWHAELHRDTAVERLDLKSPGGRERMGALLDAADLLLLSTRPSARRRLELDAESVGARADPPCVVALVGDARQPERAGHDLTYQAAAGLVDPPRLPRVLLADLVAAERVVSAALGLLLERARGMAATAPAAAFREVTVSMAAAARDAAEPVRQGLTAPGGVLGGGNAGYALYRAADGWVAVAALEDHFRERLREEAGIGSTEDEVEALSQAFLGRTAAEWEAWGREADVPVVAVR